MSLDPEQNYQRANSYRSAHQQTSALLPQGALQALSDMQQCANVATDAMIRSQQGRHGPDELVLEAKAAKAAVIEADEIRKAIRRYDPKSDRDEIVQAALEAVGLIGVIVTKARQATRERAERALAGQAGI